MSPTKLVVYTVFTGSIQKELPDPFPDVSDSYDRICFTDDMSIQAKKWKLIPLDTFFLDSARSSRLPKIMPHRYLPDYEWSLYIDTTVRFKRPPTEIFNQYMGQGVNYWCTPHPWRDCIYDEAEEIIRFGFDDEKRIREQIDGYRKMGYPEKAGLAANTLLLRKHNQEDVIRFGEVWFWHILRYSKRDQLSFPFLAEKLKLNFGYFDLNLQDNAFWSWPGFDTPKLPGDFDENTYLWLNPEARVSGVSPSKHYFSVGLKQHSPYAKRKWLLTQLANKYKLGVGDHYFNKHNYTSVYENLFQHLREQPIRMLVLGLVSSEDEIPGQNVPYDRAPILQMWHEYFPFAQIVGFDANDFSIVPPIPNVLILRGKIEDKADLQKILYGGDFDIIIDRSREEHLQQLALSILYSQLKQGGFYILEDLTPAASQVITPKTKDLLEFLKLGIFIRSPWISMATLVRIYVESTLQFFDSFDTTFTRTSDSLGVLKRIRLRGGFLEKFKLWRGIRLGAYIIGAWLRKALFSRENT